MYRSHNRPSSCLSVCSLAVAGASPHFAHVIQVLHTELHAVAAAAAIQQLYSVNIEALQCQLQLYHILIVLDTAVNLSMEV